MSPLAMRNERQLLMPIGVAAAPSHKRVRADALPEYTRYRDDGCDIHPKCLTCPLPRCRYDEPGGLRALLNAYRDQEIRELRLKGVAVDELAGRFGVSRRTVFRVLESGSERPPKAGDMHSRRPMQQTNGVAGAAQDAAAPVFIRQPDTRREAHCA